MNRITVESFGNVLRSYFNTTNVLPNKVAIALSGGADSMLLTYLLTQYKHLYSPTTEIFAITIDHKYRPESSEETKHIHDIIKQWDVNHVVKTLTYEQDVNSIGNFEEVARHKRYLEFENVCKEERISSLFMGHHLDDQLETFIQRLQGNSSIYGLAGTRKVTRLPRNDLLPIDNHHCVYVYRPFLNFEKKDIVETCKLNNVKYFNDPTNQDIELTRRNYLRHLISEVIPTKITQDSNYNCISRNALRDTHDEVYNLAESFEIKANNIKTMIENNHYIKTNNSMGTLKIKLPRSLFTKPNEIVLGKYFYQILYPYSTLKHYHWAYAKLERQLIPKIQTFLDSNNTKFKTTNMNLTFDIRLVGDLLDIEIKRQPITTGDDVSLQINVTKNWSKYVLFDRRFWIRFSSNKDINVKVVPYIHHKQDKPKLIQDLRTKKVNSNLNTLPCVMYNEEIIAFPSIGLISEQFKDILKMECSLKENKYGRLD